MGSRMARRLQDAGYELVLNDVKDEEQLPSGLTAEGTQFVETVGEVAQIAEVVLLSLPGPRSVVEVADQLGKACHRDASRMTLCIDTSTCGPDASRRAAESLGSAGVAFIDAPVSGGVGGAAAGTLTFMLSGSEGDLASAASVLEHLGSRLVHVGPAPGMGQVAKVVNNMLEAAHLAATAEALVVTEKAGINARTMLEILNASSGRSSVTEEAFPSSVVTRKFDEGFALELCLKDVRLCNEVARALRIPAWFGASVENLLALALATATDADPDYTRVVDVYERWAGVSIGAVGVSRAGP